MNACKDKGTRGVTWCLVAMCSFALLIWAKLRLVTGVPRTAYAVPEESPTPKPVPDQKAGVDATSPPAATTPPQR
jgi:hypothetical protein